MAPPSKLRSPLLFSLLLSISFTGCRTTTPPQAPKVAPIPNPFPDGYEDDKTGLSIPARLNELYLQAITDYEAKTPGLGTGLSYRGRDTKLEIFIYKNGASIIPTGVDPPLVQESFAKAIGDVEQAVDEGRYSNYRFLSHRVKDLGGQLFLKAEFSYSEQVATKHSILYVTGFNTRIVKVRLTTHFDTQSKVNERIRLVEDALGTICQKSLRKGYVGLSQSQVLKIQNDVSQIDPSDGISQREAVTIAQIELIQKDLAGIWNLLNWTPVATASTHSVSIEFPPLNRSKVASQTPLRATVDSSGRATYENL